MLVAFRVISWRICPEPQIDLLIMQDYAKEIRSRANESLLREEWSEAIRLYSEYIDHCETYPELKKSLCVALSNRAEARIRLRDFENAIRDVNMALEADPAHPKSLYCKGKILLELDQYSQASECFQLALEHQPHTAEFMESLEKSRRFESQARNGTFDLSEWISNGFAGRPPECAEYVGPVEIRFSNVGPGERGLFVTRDVEAGTLLAVCKPVAIARAILPEKFADNARMVIWKDFVTEIERVARRSGRVLRKIYTLAESDDENRKKDLGIPDIELFKANTALGFEGPCEPVDLKRILGIADINTLSEKGCGVKKPGHDLYYSNENDCMGLWVLPAFVNHSCSPNAGRLHVGDNVFIHAARDLKAGEEVTFAYFDVLLPLGTRRESCKTWSFVCKCHRCELEQSLEEDLRGIEDEFGRINKNGGETEMTKFALKLEQKLKQLQGRVKAKDRQLIRASFAKAYWPMFRSPVLLKKWSRQMPSIESVIDAVTCALPGDETALCAAATVVDKLKVNKGVSLYRKAMDQALRICKGLYGKPMKSSVMKDLIDAHVDNRGIIGPRSCIF